VFFWDAGRSTWVLVLYGALLAVDFVVPNGHDASGSLVR